MFRSLSAFLLASLLLSPRVDAQDGAEVEFPPYSAQKAVVEFFFNEPAHINGALFWLRSLINPLTSEPYDHGIDDLSIKVVIHGAEIVTLAKHNYEKYRDAVERMRYYADLGVEFRVCALSAQDYGYTPDDLQDFVQVVPSAMVDLIHWQEQGYGFLEPKVLEKRYTIEEIR